MSARLLHIQLTLSVLCAGICLIPACRNEPAPDPGQAAAASTGKRPLDRLAPGELGQGDSDLFGLPLPRGMSVQGKFRDFAVATGALGEDAVAGYVKDHVEADRVEVGGSRTVFPAVRIRGGSPDRLFRVEIFSEGAATRLLVRDITPPPRLPPPNPDERPSNEELWRRAGFTPEGKPLDQKALE